MYIITKTDCDDELRVPLEKSKKKAKKTCIS